MVGKYTSPMDASWETVFFLAHFVRFLRSKVFVPKYTLYIIYMQLYNIPLSMVYFKNTLNYAGRFPILVAQGDDILGMGDFLPAITLNDDVESISAGKHHTCAWPKKIRRLPCKPCRGWLTETETYFPFQLYCRNVPFL